MKRKILSLALIAALVFALSVSAFAVGSGEKEDVITTSKDGTITAASEEVKAEATNAYKGFTSTIWQLVKDAAPDADGFYVPKVLDVFDYEGVPGWNTFTNVPGVKADSIVVVLHKSSQTGEWEMIPTKVLGEGTIVADFGDDFSPVAILLVEPFYSNDPEPPTVTTPEQPVVTSPQTSDIG